MDSAHIHTEETFMTTTKDGKDRKTDRRPGPVH